MGRGCIRTANAGGRDAHCSGSEPIPAQRLPLARGGDQASHRHVLIYLEQADCHEVRGAYLRFQREWDRRDICVRGLLRGESHRRLRRHLPISCAQQQPRRDGPQGGALLDRGGRVPDRADRGRAGGQRDAHAWSRSARPRRLLSDAVVHHVFDASFSAARIHNGGAMAEPRAHSGERAGGQLHAGADERGARPHGRRCGHLTDHGRDGPRRRQGRVPARDQWHGRVARRPGRLAADRVSHVRRGAGGVGVGARLTARVDHLRTGRAELVQAHHRLFRARRRAVGHVCAVRLRGAAGALPALCGRGRGQRAARLPPGSRRRPLPQGHAAGVDGPGRLLAVRGRGG
mmetsp:Transcript_11743/g.34560  ORF Transcript_11743/g.34560 Transcript_11743/m.34560 type:complete len:345 (+) Transcript_11743:220-1254(+)